VKTYVVFEPADGGRDTDAADRVIFLREKFRWLALFLGPLWLLWHRLWLGFLGWLVAVVAIAFAAFAFGLDAQTAAPLLWLPTLVVAFEGSELRRRKLLRRGWREAGVIVAGDLEEAERRFFADWSARADVPVHRALAPRPVPPPAASNPVVGLFPEPGGRR